MLNISFKSNSDKKRKGRKKNGSKASALTKPTISEENIDYTLPENYAVDFFCNHRVSKKKNTGGFELKARWKGFTEGEDTWEPLTNQAEDNPALVKKYLREIRAEQAEPIKSALKDLSVFFSKEVVEMLLDS
jgi:hypothetical protein